MHEVIDYSKNFLTGITKTVKKNKEDTMYRGVATIQMFDKRNKLIQEVKSTNCISNAFGSYLYRMFFKDTLLGNSTNSLGQFARYMLLTNNNEDENPNKKFIKGDIIGWADGWNSYSGSDTLKGSLNTRETVANEWNRHIVIDFPTHACNGTFKSIYWANGCFGFTTEERVNPIKDVEFTWDSGYSRIASINNVLYIKNNTNEIGKFDILTGVYKGKVNLDDKYDTITNDSTNLYCVKQDKFIKLDTELKTLNTITIKGIDSSIISALAYVEGLLLVTEDKFILVDYNTGSIIRQTNKDRTYTRGFVKEGSYAINFGGYNTYRYDIKNNKIDFTPEDFKRPLYIGNNDIHNICQDEVKNKSYLFYNGDIYRSSIMPYFSHTLLPEPITKTSANTMKVQYDFVVEPKGYFDI